MGIQDVIDNLDSGEMDDRVRYLELIRLNSTEQEDQEELAALAQKFGKTGHDLAVDNHLVTRFDAHADKISSGLKTARDEAEAAEKTYRQETAPAEIAALKAQHEAEMKQLLADHASAHAALLDTFNLAHRPYVEALEAIEAKNALLREHPKLFAGESPSTPSEIA